jgi:isopropylmalate/isohomocitrate dehydrogenase-like protein
VDTILVAAGDGIGPEVVEATLHVMDGLGMDFELIMEPVGMAGIQERGEAMTDGTLELARQADAVLLGAIETPPPGGPYRSPLLTLRRELDLFANVRPARPLLPSLSRLASPGHGAPRPGLDVVIVRENTEGLYSRREREVEGGAVAEKVVTREASERIAHFALEWAQGNDRTKVTCIHKANVLRLSDGLFLDSFDRVAREMAGPLTIDALHVDAAAAAMVTDPGSLDVLVTTNLYGDILSDLAAALCGGLGLAPSASIGEEHALFEPVHGSAPDIAGKGIANPVGCILSAVMMLEHLGHPHEAGTLRSAVVSVIEDGTVTPDLGGDRTTLGFAEAVRELLDG